ncbi:unnamed protein product, partial [Closterium sp. NIES-53]
SLPPLPQGPGPTCVPCVEGRQRAAPHSSQFPPTEAPLQTLHMDVWGPARVSGQGHERYFLLVVDDYSRYTSVFPLRSKGDVTEVLIDWIRATRLQLRRSFGSDFPVLHLHSDRGGEFSSGLLGAYCRARGIRQTFTLPDSPQQNGIAERRIGMVMDVARTSMMHAAAPHFLWPFAVRYAAHQINLHPRVSRPETSPALLWTGKVGDASAFRVWGSRAFVRDLSADKLSPRAAPCAFLGFPPDAPGWQFYHPTSRRVLSSQDVTFDESVPCYRLFPYRTPSLPPPPALSCPNAVERVEVTGDSGAAGGAEPGGADSGGAAPGGTATGGAEPGGAEPGGARRGGGGAATGGAEPGGAELGGAELGGTVLGGADPGGAATGGAEPGGAEPGCAPPGGAELRGAPPRGSPGASSLREPLSLQELREWFARRWRRAASAGGSSATEGAAVAGPGGARTVSTRAAGLVSSTGAGAAEGVGTETTAGGPAGGPPGAAGGSGATGGAAGEGAPAGGTGAVPAESGVAARPRPYFVPLLEQVLGSPPSTGLPPSLACPQPVQSQLQSQPPSPLPAPSPYTGPTGGLAERREPASRPASSVRAARTSGRGSRQRPPPVPGTHRMSLRPSTAPLHVPLPSPPESSLPTLADPESDSLRAASPTVTRLLATVVTDPSFEPTAASALVTELVDFAASCRLDYAASLVTESESVYPPSVGGSLGARESGTLLGTAPAQTLHTFTLDSGASRCFFHDSTTLTPLPAPVPVKQADPSGCPVVARSSTVLPCPAVPSGSLSALHLLSAASPTVSRLLATAVRDPSFESAAASALVAELLNFAAAACGLDYATALVAESGSASPPSVGGECALGTDVLEERQEDFECLAATVPRFASMLLAPEGDPDAPNIPTSRSYTEAIMDTYVDKVPPRGANIVDGMWIFRVKWPPGSPPAFKARYVARGFSQREGVDYFQTFSPTSKMTSLRVLLHVAAQRDYELHSLDFSTQWSLRRPIYVLRQARREWHNTLRTTLAALGFAPATADPSLFLHTDTSLPPFYVFVYVDDLVFATADTDAVTLISQDRERHTITLIQSHMVHQRFGFQFSSPQPTPLSTAQSLSTPPSDDSVERSGPYPELVGCLMYRMTCTRPDLAYPLSLLARYLAPGRHRKVHWDAAKRVLRYLCSTSGMGLVLGGQGPFVLTGHADASWRGQLRLAYVATRANTADIFTKALPLGDHQRFSTVLGLLALHFLTGLGGGRKGSTAPAPPPPPSPPSPCCGCSSGGEGMGVAGVSELLPPLLLSPPLLHMLLWGTGGGGGEEGVGELREWR